MKTFYFLVLCVLYASFSCQGVDKHGSAGEFFDADNLLHLKIGDQMLPEVDGAEFFSIDRIVQLQTGPQSLLSNHLEKVLFFQDRIYVLDSHIGKGVYVFNIDGEYLHKIVEEVDGPLQMTMITDFVIDPVNEEIQLLDMKVQKVFRFTLDGVFIGNTDIPIESSKFELLDTQYVFYPVKNPDYDDGYYFNSWRIDGNEVVGHFPYIGNRNGQFSWSHKISVHENTISLWEPFNDTIYQLKGDDDKYKVFVDFGKRRIDETIWDIDLAAKIAYVEDLRGDKFLLINNVVSTDNFLYFNFFSSEGIRNVIYDYETGQNRIFEQFSFDGNKRLKKIASLANDNYLYAVVSEGDEDQNLVAVSPGDNPSIVFLKLNQ